MTEFENGSRRGAAAETHSNQEEQKGRGTTGACVDSQFTEVCDCARRVFLARNGCNRAADPGETP
jgi:hypothetical protein